MINFKYISQLKNKADVIEKEDGRVAYQILDTISRDIRAFDSQASEVLKLSKNSMNEALNSRISSGRKLLKEAIEKLTNLDKKIKFFKKSLVPSVINSKININSLQGLKIDSANNLLESATEECLEAKLLLIYLTTRKIDVPKEEIFNDLNIYVGGLCDMCGELIRKARLEVIDHNRNIDNIKKYYDDTKSIYDTLSSFAFSNRSGLRAKIENIKGYIGNFERILYDLTIIEK